MAGSRHWFQAASLGAACAIIGGALALGAGSANSLPMVHGVVSDPALTPHVETVSHRWHRRHRAHRFYRHRGARAVIIAPYGPYSYYPYTYARPYPYSYNYGYGSYSSRTRESGASKHGD